MRHAPLRRVGMRAAGLSLLLLALPPSAAAQAADARQWALGRALFTGGVQPSCVVCHTLKEAGSEGAVGPVLDELQPDAARVAAALRNGVGNMPSYRALLNDEQIAALAVYVSRAAGGGAAPR